MIQKSEEKTVAAPIAGFIEDRCCPLSVPWRRRKHEFDDLCTFLILNCSELHSFIVWWENWLYVLFFFNGACTIIGKSWYHRSSAVNHLPYLIPRSTWETETRWTWSTWRLIRGLEFNQVRFQLDCKTQYCVKRFTALTKYPGYNHPWWFYFLPYFGSLRDHGSSNLICSWHFEILILGA